VEKSSQALHGTMSRKSSFREGRRPRARTLGCAGFDAGAFQSETAPSIAYRAKKPPLTYAGILVADLRFFKNIYYCNCRRSAHVLILPMLGNHWILWKQWRRKFQRGPM